MNTTKFKNLIPQLFQTEKQREARLLAEAETVRLDREHKTSIARRAADLHDRLTEAKAVEVRLLDRFERLINWPREKILADFVGGTIPPETLCGRLGELDSAKRYAAEITKYIHKKIVVEAEVELAAFLKSNAKDLAGVIFKAVEESPTAKVILGDDHYTKGASSKLAREASGVPEARAT
jgi:hypothetical protein